MTLSEIFAGDTLQYSVSVPDYPASGGYTLTYRLVPLIGAGAAITFSATASGDAYAVSVAAATTAAWTAGQYSWTSYVTLAGARYTVGQGVLTLKPDPAAMAAGTETRSQAAVALAACKAALATLAADPARKSYTIGDVTVTFADKADLLRLVSYWESEVQRDTAAAAIAAGLKNPNRIYVRGLRG